MVCIAAPGRKQRWGEETRMSLILQCASFVSIDIMLQAGSKLNIPKIIAFFRLLRRQTPNLPSGFACRERRDASSICLAADQPQSRLIKSICQRRGWLVGFGSPNTSRQTCEIHWPYWPLPPSGSLVTAAASQPVTSSQPQCSIFHQYDSWRPAIWFKSNVHHFVRVARLRSPARIH